MTMTPSPSLVQWQRRPVPDSVYQRQCVDTGKCAFLIFDYFSLIQSDDDSGLLPSQPFPDNDSPALATPKLITIAMTMAIPSPRVTTSSPHLSDDPQPSLTR